MSSGSLPRTGPWWPNDLPPDFATLGVVGVESPAAINFYASPLCYAGGSCIIPTPKNGTPFSVSGGDVEIVLSHLSTKSYREEEIFYSEIVTETHEKNYLWNIIANSLDIFAGKNDIYRSIAVNMHDIIGVPNTLYQYEGFNINIPNGAKITGAILEYSMQISESYFAVEDQYEETHLITGEELLSEYQVVWKEAMDFRKHIIKELIDSEEIELIIPGTNTATTQIPDMPFQPWQLIANIPTSGNADTSSSPGFHNYFYPKQTKEKRAPLSIFDIVPMNSGIWARNNENIIYWDTKSALSAEFDWMFRFSDQSPYNWVHIGLEYSVHKDSDIPEWLPNTLYERGDKVQFDGDVWRAAESFTSGNTFDTVNWIKDNDSNKARDYWDGNSRVHALEFKPGNQINNMYAGTPDAGTLKDAIGIWYNVAILPAYMTFPEIYQCLVGSGEAWDWVSSNKSISAKSMAARRAILNKDFMSVDVKRLFLTSGSKRNAVPSAPLPSADMIYFALFDVTSKLMSGFGWDGISAVATISFYIPETGGITTPGYQGPNIRAKLYHPIYHDEGFAHELSVRTIWFAQDLVFMFRVGSTGQFGGFYGIVGGATGNEPIWMVTMTGVSPGLLSLNEKLFWNPVFRGSIDDGYGEGTLIHHADSFNFINNKIKGSFRTKKTLTRPSSGVWSTSLSIDKDIIVTEETGIESGIVSNNGISVYHLGQTSEIFGFTAPSSKRLTEDYMPNNGLGMWNLGSIQFFADGSSHMIARGQLKIKVKTRTLYPENKARLEFRFFLVDVNKFTNRCPDGFFNNHHYWETEIIEEENMSGKYELSFKLSRGKTISEEDETIPNDTTTPNAAGYEVFWNNLSIYKDDDEIDEDEKFISKNIRKNEGFFTTDFSETAQELNLTFLLDLFDEENSIYQTDDSWRADQYFDLGSGGLDGIQLYMHVSAWSDTVEMDPPDLEEDFLDLYLFDFGESFNTTPGSKIDTSGSEISESNKIKKFEEMFFNKKQYNAVILYVGDNDFNISLPVYKIQSDTNGLSQFYTTSFRNINNIDFNIVGVLQTYVPPIIQTELMNSDAQLLYKGKVSGDVTEAQYSIIPLLTKTLLKESEYVSGYPGYFLLIVANFTEEEISSGEIDSIHLLSNEKFSSILQIASKNLRNSSDFVTFNNLIENLFVRGDDKTKFRLRINLEDSSIYNRANSKIGEIDNNLLGCYVHITYFMSANSPQTTILGPIFAPIISYEDNALVMDLGSQKANITLFGSGKICVKILPIVIKNTSKALGAALRCESVEVYAEIEKNNENVEERSPFGIIDISNRLFPATGPGIHYYRGLPILGYGGAKKSYGASSSTEIGIFITKDALDKFLIIDSKSDAGFSLLIASPIINVNLKQRYGYVMDITSAQTFTQAFIVLRSGGSGKGIYSGLGGSRDPVISSAMTSAITDLETRIVKLFQSPGYAGPLEVSSIKLDGDSQKTIKADYTTTVANDTINQDSNVSVRSSIILAIDNTNLDPGHATLKVAMYDPQSGTVMPPTIPREYTEEGFTEENCIVLKDIDYITAKASAVGSGFYVVGLHTTGGLTFSSFNINNMPDTLPIHIEGPLPNLKDEVAGYGKLDGNVIINSWPFNPVRRGYADPVSNSLAGISSIPTLDKKRYPRVTIGYTEEQRKKSNTIKVGKAQLENIPANMPDGWGIEKATPVIINGPRGEVILLYKYARNYAGSLLSPFVGRIYAMCSNNSGESWTPPTCVFSMSPFYPRSDIANYSFIDIDEIETNAGFNFGFSENELYPELNPLKSLSSDEFDNIAINEFDITYINSASSYLLSFWLDGFICYTNITQSVRYLYKMCRMMKGSKARGTETYPWYSPKYEKIYMEEWRNAKIKYPYTWRFWYPEVFTPIHLAAGDMDLISDDDGDFIPDLSIDDPGSYLLKAYSNIFLNNNGKKKFDNEWDTYFPPGIIVGMTPKNAKNEIDAIRMAKFSVSQPRQKPAIIFEPNNGQIMLQFASTDGRFSHAPCALSENEPRSAYHPLEIESSMLDNNEEEIE